MVMFLSDTHLPQLLPAKAYCDEKWYAKEVSDVLLPGWHAVAATNQFPKNGSFVTLDLFGHPVILRRERDEIHGFLNICPHRFSKLSTELSGCKTILKCGYHGWEFDECSGHTRRIPDAPSFRPLKKGQFGLEKVQVKTVGGLVFVSLSGKTSGSNQVFSEASAEFEKILNARGFLGQQEFSLPVNWKVAIENTLESYHVAEVHPKTFGKAPEEQDCRHEILSDSTRFSASGDNRFMISSIESLLLSKLGHARSGKYEHIHYHPTFTLARTDCFSIAISFLPNSARTTRVFVSWFAQQTTKGRNYTNWILRRWGAMQSSFWLKVVREDARAVIGVQSGIDGALRSGGESDKRGLISIREERIFHFQKWLADRIGYVKKNELVSSA